MKYILGLAVLMAIWCYYLNYRVDELKKQNMALESEKNGLYLIIKEYKKNEVEANNTIAKLRGKISEDKTALEWYNTNLPSSIANELHNKN